MVKGGIWAARALGERQFTLEGKARYANKWGSVHWEGMYSGRMHTEDVNFFNY